MYDTFFTTLIEQLAAIENDQLDAITLGGQLMQQTISRDGLIHVFGSGHAQQMGYELFFRAGGLAPINAILPFSLSSTQPKALLKQYEKQHGLAAALLAGEKETNDGDTMIVCSVGDCITVTMEMAQCAQDMGMNVIAIVNEADQAIFDAVADCVIVNSWGASDGIISLDDSYATTGHSATITSLAIVQALVAQTAHELSQKGESVPAWTSVNAAGAAEKNAAMLQHFQPRLGCL